MTARDQTVADLPAAPPAAATAGRPGLLRARRLALRAQPVLLALVVPALLFAFWQFATANRWTRLIPLTCTRRGSPAAAPSRSPESVAVTGS